MKKNNKKELESALLRAIEDHLSKQNIQAAKAINKEVKKSSKQLAKKFNKAVKKLGKKKGPVIKARASKKTTTNKVAPKK